LCGLLIRTAWIVLSAKRRYTCRFLAHAHARLGQFNDAWRCIGEALAASDASKESWYDADIHRLAGIVLLSGEPDTAKAEAHFESALAVARQQQAKS
jgi:hypothetical protein